MSNDLRVSNHSYGRLCGWNQAGTYWYGDRSISTNEDLYFGRYDSDATNIDQIVYEGVFHLPVWSVGNDCGHYSGAQPIWHWVPNPTLVWTNLVHEVDGGGNGFDSIASHKGAKNVLTVGAVSDIVGGYSTTSDVVMTSFSSFGPMDDGRIKPDIVANGVSLYTPMAASDSDYDNASGSSFAAPSVAGSIGLLVELNELLRGTNRPLFASTLKALVIHTADEAGGAPGPDYRFGWGLMNTLTAAQVMSNNAVWGYFKPHIKEVVLPDQDYIEFRVEADTNQPLRVTICWTDPPGQEHPYELDPTNIVLVNDLDLRVIDPSGSVTNKPWVLNPSSPAVAATTGDNIRDNVEQVHIENPSNGWYTVNVTHKGTLSSGVQDVSIIVTGNTPTNAPEFKIIEFSLTPKPYHLMEWGSVVGSVYRIWTMTNLLESGAWTNGIADDMSCTKETTSWPDEAYTGAVDNVRFYRVKTIE